MKVSLLRKVQKAILAEPRQFDMDSWFSEGYNAGYPIPNCGTAACIGGWAIAISRGLKPSEAAGLWGKTHSEQALGLTSNQGFRLFYFDHWPRRFRLQYNKGNLTRRATVASKRIDFFVKTKGTDRMPRKGKVAA